MLPVEKAPDENTAAAPTLTLHVLPVRTVVDAVPQIVDPAGDVDSATALSEEEEYYKEICGRLDKVQNTLQTRNGFIVTVTGAGAALTSFFLTNGEHAYLAKSILHSPRFIIPVGLLYVVMYTTPFIICAACFVVAGAQLPGGGEGGHSGMISIYDWFRSSPEAYKRYRSAREKAALQNDAQKLESLRHRTFAADRNLARKSGLSRIGTLIYCLLISEFGIGVLAIALLLLLAIGQPAPR